MAEEVEFYTGEPGRQRETPVELPPSIHDLMRAKETYIPDEGLKAAVNVALLLGLPLLLTGPPGCGKTRLAYAVAAELGLGAPREVVVKSDASSRDLLYSYDELGRFQDAQASSREDSEGAESIARPLLAYLRFQPLGEAILRAGGASAEVKLLGGHAFRGRHRHEVPKTFFDLAPYLFEERRKPSQSVVLVDELDKAPRDLPNDLLREIEDMAFDVKELGIRIEVPRNEDTKLPVARPVLVITSNSERSLPEPLLRRVSFYDIPEASNEKLEAIVKLRFTELHNPLAVENAIKLFRRIVEELPIGERAPGTAEFLTWFSYLNMRGLGSSYDDPRKMPDALRASLGLLVKRAEALSASVSLVDAELRLVQSNLDER